MARRPIPDTSWGGGCGDKKLSLMFVVLRVVFVMLRHPRSTYRYVRHGETP